MGTLYIVATPIGNLKDITLRAIEVLKAVDLVLCEDTRVTGKLLANFDISKKLLAVNDFNEERKVIEVISYLKRGMSLAILSDAGTPLVSDPGFKVVRAVIAKGIRVEAIPGPTAAIAALCVSGLPTDKFLFLGFLPKKDGKRVQMLEKTKSALGIMKSTVIIYESPFRVLKTLEQIKEVFGDIDVVVCRELTKLHEDVLRGKISELIAKIEPKGEFVILM